MNAHTGTAATASHGWVMRLRRKTATTGLDSVVTAAANQLFVKGASLHLVNALMLEADDLVATPIDMTLETRFLAADELTAYTTQPGYELSPDFAGRIDRGLDKCFGVLVEGRLASYAWLAFRSVEPEHAAGVALGLPSDVAYLYKAFTHPAYRGRRLYGLATAAAFRALEGRGIRHLLAFVYWNNRSALRACERMGYRRLGTMLSKGGTPLHVPEVARLMGIRFGADAQPLLAVRRRALAPAGPVDVGA